jgi:hypothetical protein
MNNIRWFVSSLLLTLCTMSHVQADYFFSNIGEEYSKDAWLFQSKPMTDAANKALKKGLKHLGITILNTVGTAIVEYYSPTIADFLFKQEDPMLKHVQRLTDEIRNSHDDIARRHRILIDEIMDQNDANIEADFRWATDKISDWNSHPEMQFDTLEMLLTAADKLAEIRHFIEEYIKKQSIDSRTQYRRLQHLPLHITVTSLELTTRQMYWNNLVIKKAFEAEYGLTASNNQYTDWVNSLSDADIEIMQLSANGDGSHLASTVDRVLDFYEALSNRDDVARFVEDAFTPKVYYTAEFQENPGSYDNPELTDDEGNWYTTDPGRLTPVLDGVRWYYYVDVPKAECLEGLAYRDLKQREGELMAEDPDQPSKSKCNRFWIVDPRVFSTAHPEYYYVKTSIDGYDMWFNSPSDIYSIHQELIKGELLFPVYVALTAFLDKVYTIHKGGERPDNKWDQAITRHDELVAILATGESYDVTADKSKRLKSWGASIETVGLGNWVKMLEIYVEDPDTVENALSRLLTARRNFDWMRKDSHILPPDDLLWCLLDDGIYTMLESGVPILEISSQIEEKISREATAKFTSTNNITAHTFDMVYNPFWLEF